MLRRCGTGRLMQDARTAGFLATFGFEMVKARLTGQVARQRLFGYFALAVAVNSFILPLISDTISGNALSISESDAITESQNFITPLDQVRHLRDGLTFRSVLMLMCPCYCCCLLLLFTVVVLLLWLQPCRSFRSVLFLSECGWHQQCCAC